MQFDNLETVEALAKLPPEAPNIAEPKTSAWTAPLRTVPAAVADTLAGAAEVGTAAYRSLQQMDEGGSAGRRQRDRFGVQPVTGETEVSRSLRNVAESYGPDPVTAGEAERLVFGLTRGIVKAVAYGLTTGPAAPFLFGADEGLTTMDQLQRQGVDTATAAKAGAVAGVVNAAGFLIPVAGKTVAGTIGLGALSGPASFVAQQAGTREILRAADYGQIADQFDPLDPVGLGVSLLPFGFGAWAMRARVKGGARPAADPVARGSDATAKQEATPPAADAPPAPKVAETVPKVEPAQPGPDPVPAAAVEPVRPFVQQEHIDAAMVHNLTEFEAGTRANPPEKFEAELWRGPVTENPNFKAWFGESKVIQPDGAPMVVYHGTTYELDAIRSKAETQDAGHAAGIYLTHDPEYAGKYTSRWSPGGDDPSGGNILPVYVALQNPLIVEGDALGTAAVSRERVTELKSQGYDGIINRAGDEIVAFDPTQIKSAIGNSGRFDPASASLTDPVPQAKAEPAQPKAEAAAAPAVPEAPNPQDKAQATAVSAIEPGSGPDAALIESVRVRGEQVVREAPDLVVGMTEDGTPITARQELERIRREAAEGTADEMGANDAALLDIAVQCALSVGE